MYPWLTGILGVFLLCGTCGAEETFVLEDENDRINYSIGYQIGGDFKNQDMELNPEALIQGIKDAQSGDRPLMHPKEMRATLVDLKKKIVAAQEEQRKDVAKKNLMEGQTFLAENAKKEGVKTLPSGMQYRIVREGKGAPPEAKDTVTVHYRGTLIDGTEFDSSYRRNQPATFRADRVIKGWKEALQIMKPGSKYELYIPPELAYGEQGGGSKIGPNRTLIFEVELISVQREGGKSARHP